MKKIYIIILLVLLLMPVNVFATGNFNVSKASVSLKVGETVQINVSATNSAGRINVSTSDSKVATVSPSSIFLDNDTQTITITGKKAGSATISVVASNNYATYDEEILNGTKKTINVEVYADGSTLEEITVNPETGESMRIAIISCLLIFAVIIFRKYIFKR